MLLVSKIQTVKLFINMGEDSKSKFPMFQQYKYKRQETEQGYTNNIV